MTLSATIYRVLGEEREWEHEHEHEHEYEHEHEHEHEHERDLILSYIPILYAIYRRVNANVNVNCMATLGFRNYH